MIEISITIAFLAGIISFLSPCVLPIIPGFLAFLAGESFEGNDHKPRQRNIFINSVAFVLGFSVVFAVLGVILNSFLENYATGIEVWLSRIGGAFIIFFGIYLTGLIKIPWLSASHKINVSKFQFRSRLLTSFVFGVAFAVGWTPCVGAALGAILGLAASAPSSAFVLLLTYSLGLGLPFLIIGLFTAKSSEIIKRYAEKLVWIEKFFGVILVILGILVFTQSLNLVANFDFVNELIL